MATKTIVSVYNITDGKKSEQVVDLPLVFSSPIRPDIVNFVHTNIRKNHRQAHGVFKRAGHETTAESWGTGRAVARIPRVGGGGTGRSGQGAYGNMCRGGHMFAPKRIWRRWHRHVNVNQRRYAICSALAASAITSLVMARGHKIDHVPEIPLVVDDSIQGTLKTKNAVAILKAIGAYDDVEKAANSYKIRSGIGKMRNRRHVMRKGPLVIYKEDSGIGKAFRNIPGIDLLCVTRLNLLQLAPGGHLGRFIIWTKSAMDYLNSAYTNDSNNHNSHIKYISPNMMKLPDIKRIINSDEIQTKLRPKKQLSRIYRKRNPYKNRHVMDQLNPYAKIQRKLHKVQKKHTQTLDKKLLEKRKAAYFCQMMSEEKPYVPFKKPNKPHKKHAPAATAATTATETKKE